MFGQLSQRLTGILDKIRSKGALAEDDVNIALREIRIALLEADVALSVVKDFISRVREKAIGQEVIKSISPGQQVVKIVHDQLVALLEGEKPEDSNLNLAVQTPAVIMMAGLQGSGKTTTTAKIAHFLQKRANKKVLMASVDIYRPAARDQLQILGKQLDIPTTQIIQDEKPLQIAEKALKTAKQGGYDVLMLDTAGRLHIDKELMDELVQLKNQLKPVEILLVADSMTGQDAVNMAEAFHETLNVTGIVLTRVDGDARGGAALSIRAVTNRPIKFLGTGEKTDQLELFDAKRVAARILDMGDIVGLVEKAVLQVDAKEQELMASRIAKGQFTLEDMAGYLQQMLKMGGLTGLMGMLPGVGKIKEKLAASGMDDKVLRRQIAIVHSMTPKERVRPQILNASRRRRIAAGAGQTVADVNRLLKQYDQMSHAMKQMHKLGQKGMMRQGMGNMLKNLFSR